jgi:mono/diheme cytochrome c family protein
MGLFGGKSKSIYKDQKDTSSYKATPKSCGQCHGTGQRLNGAGRPIGGKCRSCGGKGAR